MHSENKSLNPHQRMVSNKIIFNKFKTHLADYDIVCELTKNNMLI